MTVTIKDHLRRRTRLLFAIGFAGWLTCAGSAFVVNADTPCRPHCGGNRPPPTIFLGLPLFLGAAIGLAFFVKCPRCTGRLGFVAGAAMTRGVLTRPINFCPFCGVNLNEPLTKS
jgi:hypothetical protein